MRAKASSTVFGLLLIAGMGQFAIGGQPENADWRISGGGRIRGISPRSRPVPKRDASTKPKAHRKSLSSSAIGRSARALEKQKPKKRQFQPASSALVIDSPPIDGFVPWMAFSVTGEKSGLYETDAIPKMTVGTLLSGRQADYAIGLMDTGASIHVLGNGSATRVGMFSGNPDRVTSNTVQINGVTGSVNAWVSHPVGVYVDGLQAIHPTLLTLNQTGMVGETNVATAVGQPVPPNQPDLATAIGAPMFVYYAAVVSNDQVLTRTINSITYTAPEIHMYDVEDAAVPEHPIYIPLELRPLGSSTVQYVPCISIFGSCPDGDGSPDTPSIIIGNSSQSLFFVSSVDMYDGNKSAIDKDRFMIDTGAQVTVIGQRIAARLGVNPANPDFEVEIEGVDGSSIMAPGFYIDKIEIPALGEWLNFTNVPVVLLDIASPEGGTLDGIIGMNLFNNYNFVFRGGGLTGWPDPSLECKIIVPGLTDVDYDNDGDVDQSDFGHLQKCYSGPDTPQNDPACQNALLDADSDVDGSDMQIFIACASGPAIPAAAECAP